MNHSSENDNDIIVMYNMNFSSETANNIIPEEMPKYMKNVLNKLINAVEDNKLPTPYFRCHNWNDEYDDPISPEIYNRYWIIDLKCPLVFLPKEGVSVKIFYNHVSVFYPNKNFTSDNFNYSTTYNKEIDKAKTLLLTYINEVNEVVASERW